MRICVVGLCIWAASLSAGAQDTAVRLREPAPIEAFFEAASPDEKVARDALEKIAAGWRDNHAALIIDMARFLPRPRPPAGAAEAPLDIDDSLGGAPRSGAAGNPAARTPQAVTPQGRARERLVRFLGKQTKQRFGQDLDRWRRWIWSLPDDPHPDYARFKARLYAAVDPKMAEFFPAGVKASIRLDEVDWGGVKVNEIPPLDHPKTIAAKAAGYLGDANVVFGLVVNGQARAYPKRILAWHEMALDRLGGVELTVVYCTLCGTVIPYGSEAAGRRFTFGTSGLLYRANKLMFDAETKNLWSTTEGRPAIGSLVGSGIELTVYPVVTTTWREWRSAHPETTVLSLDTGHRRDYSEGAAYRDYFATDRLMFEVPTEDGRLKNKDEVLGLLLRPAGAGSEAPRQALAVSAAFLRKNPVYQRTFAGHDLVILTTPAGANRVYAAQGTRFVRLRDGGAEDSAGRLWRVGEEALTLDSDPATTRPRLPARRAFWFGWQAQFPGGELVR